MLGFAALSLFVALAGAEPIGVPCQTLIVSDGISTVYPVEHGLASAAPVGQFLVPGTDTVYVSGVRLDTTEYTFDYNTGSVIFWRRPEKWALILATYRCVDLPGMPKEYRLRQEPVSSYQSPVAESVSVPIAAAPIGTAESTGLGLSGSKTLGVSFGGENAGIDQATQVAIKGNVEGVGVDAELSDQSSPIPPEGTTTDIQALDKLIINLSGKQWKGSFGDVDMSFPAGDFGAIERQAIGATATGTPVSGVQLNGGYASPKGLFGRVELTGVDGSQGPYVLAPDGRSAQIVPGSEEVYVNGNRMTRGWDADYTIDYSTGEVLFTNRRVIDRLSRIEATFQYVTGDYSRAIVVGGAQLKGRGDALSGANLSVGVFSEADDPSQNFVEDLSNADRDSLAAIGADTSRAWLDGAVYAGTRKGDYVKSGDHYVYVGQDSGNYQVQFSLAGDSLGDYVYNDTILAYSYVGPKAGDYVARRRITLPERDEAAYARLGFERWGFNAAVDGLYQRRDLNLFAAGGAPVDAGALGVDAGWQDSSYGVTYQHRSQAAGFDIPGASPEVDFTYRWGGTTEAERRSGDEVTARAKPVSFFSLAGDVGRLDRFDSGPVERYEGSAQMGWLGYDVTRVGDVTRQGLLAKPRVGWFYPTAGWQTEVDSNEKSLVWTSGLSMKPTAALSAGVDYRNSGFYAPDSAGAWERTSLARLLEGTANWTSGTAYRLSAMAGLNNQHSDTSATADWNQLLAGLSGSATPKAGLSFQADFNQSYQKTQLKDELFRYVGTGQGQYRRDSITGRYYSDPQGDYQRVVVATGNFTQARQWTLNGSGDISAFNPVALTGSFSESRTSSDSAALAGLSEEDLRLVVNALQPLVTPTIGAGSQFSADRSLAATGLASSHQNGYVELFSDKLPEVEGRARLEVERTLRRLNSGDVDYHDDGWTLTASPVIGTALKLEAVLSLERQTIAEPASYPELGTFSLTSVDASLARTFSIGTRARVRAQVDIAHREATVETLPFDVELDEPLGTTPGVDLSYDHSFSDVLSASVRYSFQHRPDRASEHTLSAELKAYF